MILSSSTAVASPTAERDDAQPLDVIEVINAGRPAWLVQPVELERDSITFDFAHAGVFPTDRWQWAYSATTVWNRLRCGYPQWQCRIVRLTEAYRIEQAKHALPRLEAPAAPVHSPTADPLLLPAIP